MSESLMAPDRRITALHSARTVAAWIDRTGHGWIRLNGADRLDLLHRLTTNDLTGMQPGNGRQTVLLTEKARIIDVVTVLQHTDHAELIVAPGNTATVVSWLKKYIIMDDVRVSDRTSEVRMLEVMGPRSADVVGQLTGLDVAALAKTDWKRVEDLGLTVVRMPSSCEVSYWILGSSEAVENVANTLKAQGDELPELTLSEEEYLRVTAGMGRLGHEWSDAYNPLEAGLLHLTSFTKGCYIGQEVVARLDSYNKVKQRVMALVGTAEVAVADEVVADGAQVGRVTSVVRSTDGQRTIALAYIRGEHANVGTQIGVQHQGALVNMTIHLPPVEEPVNA